MKQSYYDVYGRCHTITRELSHGGQGIVYRTQEPDMLLKLEWDPEKREIKRDTASNRKYEDIRLLPIPGQLHITLPQSTLRDAAGYTMRLLDEMASFEEVFAGNDKEAVVNKWLGESRLVERFGLFIATGGKRKRLEAYLKSACIISQLHANGLVYCDISDRNMFVSEERGQANVWLIDIDNLDFMKNTSKNSRYHTPGYGAPEVLGGKGNTFYSDAFSFAVSLFWTMTGTHPYAGPALEEALENLDFLEIPELDYACGSNLPWIGDCEDNSNACECKIPHELIFSGDILEYFERTFGRQGRTRRTMRTTMPEWAYVLARELDRTIHCPHCEMDYDGEGAADPRRQCPWCDSRSPVLSVRSYRTKDGERAEPIWDFAREINGAETGIPMRIAEGFRSDSLDIKIFTLQLTDKEMIIDHLDGGYDFELSLDEGMCGSIYGRTEIRRGGKVKILAKKRQADRDAVWIEIEEQGYED